MLDSNRLREELEIHNAIARQNRHRREDMIINIVTAVGLIYAFVQYWFFDRPLKLARMTPVQIRARRIFWLIFWLVVLLGVSLFSSD